MSQSSTCPASHDSRSEYTLRLVDFLTLYVLDGFDVLSGRLLNALEEPDAFFADAQVQYFMLGNWLLLFTSRSGASAVPDFLDQPG